MPDDAAASTLTRLTPGRHDNGLWVQPIYFSRGYQQALPDVWLRTELLNPLLEASEAAAQAGHGLLVWDGWRSLALQRVLYRDYRAQLAADSGLVGARLDRHVAEFVADPDQWHPPPPHSTGGAVDLTLCEIATGAPRDMGGAFDELTARTVPSYYDGGSAPTESPYAALRQTLCDAMASAGFVRLPSEWWHFEYGTALWAGARGVRVLFSVSANCPPS